MQVKRAVVDLPHLRSHWLRSIHRMTRVQVTTISYIEYYTMIRVIIMTLCLFQAFLGDTTLLRHATWKH